MTLRILTIVGIVSLFVTAAAQDKSSEGKPATNGPLPATKTNSPAEPFWKTVFAGDVEGVRKKLDSGLDFTSPENGHPGGFPAFHFSVFSTQMVALFLEHGAKIETKDRHGFTTFVRAIQADKPEVAQFLLDKGADLNPKTEFAVTPLHIAAKVGATNSINFLLKKGASATAVSSNRMTPIMIALNNGQKAAARIMAKHEGLEYLEITEDEAIDDEAWVTRFHLEEAPQVGESWPSDEARVPIYVPISSKAKENVGPDGRATASSASFGGFQGFVKIDKVLVRGKCEKQAGKLVFTRGTVFIYPSALDATKPNKASEP